MPKLTNVSKVVMAAVIVAVFIVLIIVYNNGLGGTVPINNTSSSAPGATLTATSPTQTETSSLATATTHTTQVAATPRPPAIVIHMITPVAQDLWKIGTQNLISWNKPGGISGSISLINATTKAFMGVVIPQVGPNQTSYTWNTRDLLLDRTSALKKDVVSGTYMLRLTYDGNNVQPVMSPVFTITN